MCEAHEFFTNFLWTVRIMTNRIDGWPRHQAFKDLGYRPVDLCITNDLSADSALAATASCLSLQYSECQAIMCEGDESHTPKHGNTKL